MMDVIQLGFVNVFLMIGDRGVVLVDTGMKGSGSRILSVLEEKGYTPADLKLIVLTHGHLDHIGGLKEIGAVVEAPVMMSRIEYEMFLSGSDDAVPVNAFGKVIFKAISKAARFGEPLKIQEPEYLIESEYDLSAFGLKAKVMLTPGHTRGSMSVLTDDGEAIVGDSLMAMMPWSGPGRPMLATDLGEVKKSMEKLIGLGAKRFYLSHGQSYGLPRIKGAVSRL